MIHYPKETPRSKHDICCPPSLQRNDASVITTLETLTSSLHKSSTQNEPLPPTLATVYSYSDAPTFPKPFSGKLRLESLLCYSLFQSVTTNVLKRCMLGVKLPSVMQAYKHDKKYKVDVNNSKSFCDFMHRLTLQKMVGVMDVDSAGRVAFLVPLPLINNNGTNGSSGSVDEEEYHAACLYYAPMKEFISYAKENYKLKELETWTPQYTPPREEELPSNEWDEVMDTWTPQYTPPREECDEWNVTNGDAVMNGDDVPLFQHDDNLFQPPVSEDGGLFQPPVSEEGGLFQPPDSGDNLFMPPGDDFNSDGYGLASGYGVFGDQQQKSNNGEWDNGGWDNNESNQANNNSSNNMTTANSNNMTEGTFHTNAGAAAADAFYSGLTRSLDTRADSRLYHMRAFNGWVKATQIAELDPDTAQSKMGKKRSRRSPLRVLDLACGKGGDLGKWTIHSRKIDNYVGVDVARGSLIDAAIRARQMATRGVLKQCTFSLADLGEDVPGRKRSKNATRMQKLLTWSLEEETSQEREGDPVFRMREGGGISESDKFDVVSIQFAIHYMMSTRKRARRFFHTVSSLLEIGGNLIATTIDARVVVEKLMALGKDFHFDEVDLHCKVDLMENEARHCNGNKQRRVDDNGATVYAGEKVCRLKFERDILHKVFHPPKTPEDMFGLEYTFTLVEGSDHAAGVGEAVDLPEWLTPIPALKELGEEAGLELEYATNFHKFYEERKDPTRHTAAHNALYNMKVLNRNGSISEQEWDISRMYVAVKFRKVRESEIEIGDEDVGEEEMMELN